MYKEAKTLCDDHSCKRRPKTSLNALVKRSERVPKLYTLNFLCAHGGVFITPP